MKRGTSLKRKIVAVVIVTLMLVSSVPSLINDRTGASLPGGWEEVVLEGNGKKKIAEITVEGAIQHDAAHANHPILSMINFAKNDPDVQGVILNVNSPGGDVVTVDKILLEIKKLQQEGKTVVVSMGSIAASGGYYISANADRIFAHPSTITGSLGVIISFPNYKELAERVGYSELNIKSGPMKDIGDPLRTMSEDEEKVYQDIVDVSYEQFVDVISEGRNMDKDTVRKLADGRVYSGKSAKALGLIDEFGSLQDAISYIKQNTNLTSYQVVQYKPKTSVLNLFSQGINVTSTVDKVQAVLGIKLNEGPKLMYMLD